MLGNTSKSIQTIPGTMNIANIKLSFHRLYPHRNHIQKIFKTAY